MKTLSTESKGSNEKFKTPIDLSFGYQNIDGIHSPQFGCKLPFLHSKFTHDMEVLSETWGICTQETTPQRTNCWKILPLTKCLPLKKVEPLVAYWYTTKKT